MLSDCSQWLLVDESVERNSGLWPPGMRIVFAVSLLEVVERAGCRYGPYSPGLTIVPAVALLVVS